MQKRMKIIKYDAEWCPFGALSLMVAGFILGRLMPFYQFSFPQLFYEFVNLPNESIN